MTFDQSVEDRPMAAVQHASAGDRGAVHVIRVARDFSATPGGRAPKNGPYSGEVFRDTVLLPALKQVPAQFSRVVVDLDGTDTYIGSFLEEAFGGLLRGPYRRYAEIQGKLSIQGSGEFEFFRDLALEYMLEQDRKNQKAL